MPAKVENVIEVSGARVHNLKNVDVKIPRDKLVVITGLSGSGKSSLAFDTIYAEGQRRYIETFNSYARQFLGNIERPDVDMITGLSPVISIEQKTISKNPRSTVGTITEIYDFLRLLFARAATAYSHQTGEAMIKYSDDQIIELIMQEYEGKSISVLAPIIRGRKGHYKDLFEQLLRQGFLRARVDGEILDLAKRPKLDRYKIHDIELVIDNLTATEKDIKRLKGSIGVAMKHGKGDMMILDVADEAIRHFSRNLMCPTSGIAYEEPEPNLFSFNSPYGACKSCNGLGKVSDVAINKIIPDEKKSIKKGAIVALGTYKNSHIYNVLEAVLDRFGHDLTTPVNEMGESVLASILNGVDGVVTVKSKIGLRDKNLTFDGVIPYILEQAEAGSNQMKRWAAKFTHMVPCPSCEGKRLKKNALFFRIGDKNIQEVADLSIKELHAFVNGVMGSFNSKQKKIGKEIVKEISDRSGFLLDVGLDYLSLSRPSKTLSGGEAQRIRLATQIGSELVGVLYILDEPSIGLHQRDDELLIKSLKELRDAGNSVIVVEHDKEMIMSADHVLDIGPGAGSHGGYIMAHGTPKEIAKSDSLTGQYLQNKKSIAIPETRRSGNGHELTILGAAGNNLRKLNVSFPLGKFIVVTGVSGSGKSTLIADTLYPILNQHFYRGKKEPLAYDAVQGLEHLDKVIEVDQSPIGRTPRSNPATYTGMFDHIRALFAALPSAKIRGYKPGRFSFNTAGGRCETCKGAGVKIIEMNFLPEVAVPCTTCRGKRFDRETLEVRFKGKSIADVLNMSVSDAAELFSEIPKIKDIVTTLLDVGLGYLTLGQSSTTVSGGEAQRIKLASELSKRHSGNTFYILDEPTTGLHFEDVSMLVNVLNRLVEQGNTVLVIEHNMDVIKVADHIIDLGPEGGIGGGTLVAAGPPEDVVLSTQGYTAKYLKKELYP